MNQVSPKSRSKATERGNLVAIVLTGAWRRSSSSLSLSAGALAQITPLLLQIGAGALGWWRVRRCDLARSKEARPLRQAYRFNRLYARLHEREVGRAFGLLRSVGIESILAKGWLAASLYPDHGLRPYADIDLYVQPQDYDAARSALHNATNRPQSVDLHRGFTDLEDQGFDDIYTRSRLVRLHDVEVRVLGPEDHLRLLCLHLVRHGARSPLWLCDIGAALEQLANNFDWDYFLSGDRWRSKWVVSVLLLSNHLLGAGLDRAPAAVSTYRLQSWLIPTVLRQWGTSERVVPEPMLTHLCRRAGILKAARRRWPNPIEAAFRLRIPPSEFPSFPCQLADYTARALSFAARAPIFLSTGLARTYRVKFRA